MISRQRVRLIHKRRELVRAEEALDGGADRLDAEDDARQEVLLIGGGHALSSNLLHSDETESKLALQQLSNGSDALVLQVVDVVPLCFAVDVGNHRLS